MIHSFQTWLGAVIGSSLLTASAFAGPLGVLKVEGIGQELGETPLIVEVSRPMDGHHHLSLRPEDGGPSLAADVFQDRGKTYIGTVLDRVPARGTRTFGVVESASGRSGPGVDLAAHDGKKIEVVVDGRPLTTYVPDDGPKPYFFPVIGPSGEAVTRAFPMKKIEGEKTDHPHHRSLWFTHGDVNKVDFWSELANHGTIRETSRPTVMGGSVVGILRTTDDWLGPDGKKVCEDERVVRFYNTKSSRVFDFDVTLKATHGPITFGDTKEGMFGCRVASTMDVTAHIGGRIVNAGGISDKEAWGVASPWVDYTGPVQGKTVGIAILNHPESFRYPTTWHVRDYGLFAANPFGYHDFGRTDSGTYTVPDGQSIRFIYRVILHEGATASSGIAAAFDGFASPPRATLSE